MNYRHVFHAGNFADVVKHVVLARVLDYMKRKDAPFRVIDTHAGIGRYDLRSAEAGKTGEWQAGIAKLLAAVDPASANAISAPARELLAHYLAAVSDENGGGPLLRYPGSPRLALRLLREGDRLVANELHPEDNVLLKQVLARDPRARVLALDAWTALRAQLPPKERRAVVLVDPPFEATDEFDRIDRGLAEALERFPSGTYLVWYPIKDAARIRKWQHGLARLGVEKLLVVDFFLRTPTDPERLNGCGLIVVNAPYTLRAELEILLPELVKTLAETGGGRFTISTLSDLRGAPKPAKSPKIRSR